MSDTHEITDNCISVWDFKPPKLPKSKIVLDNFQDILINEKPIENIANEKYYLITRLSELLYLTIINNYDNIKNRYAMNNLSAETLRVKIYQAFKKMQTDLRQDINKKLKKQNTELVFYDILKFLDYILPEFNFNGTGIAVFDLRYDDDIQTVENIYYVGNSELYDYQALLMQEDIYTKKKYIWIEIMQPEKYVKALNITPQKFE